MHRTIFSLARHLGGFFFMSIVNRSSLGFLIAMLVTAFAPNAPLVAEPAQGNPSSSTARSAPVENPRAKDLAAIRQSMESFRKAFESRDAKTLVNHWTAEGEYHKEQGVTVRGKDELTKGFAAFFAKTPEIRAEIKPSFTRFLSRDTAIEEGIVTIRSVSAASVTTAKYNVLLAREDGKWLIAEMEESPADHLPSIDDLRWLVGEWKTADGSDAEVHSIYSIARNNNFIHAQFSIKEKALTLRGDQIIGVDPASGDLHSWTFEADGGIGEADWLRDGDHWVLDVVGTLADGRTLTETNILRRIDDHNFTWQSINRLMDDQELPDLPPVKVTRIKPAKSSP
ncbi:SgcJ/EcaC family oxidoreductase [bacterium]|nr:SgcJ/EcaC family oxidoreductase [bacterium]